MMADYGVDKYDIGTGFGHFGVAVEDVRLLFMYNSVLAFIISLCMVLRNINASPKLHVCLRT